MGNIIRFITFILSNLIIISVIAQADCRSILKKATAAYDNGKGDLDKALQYLQDTETCDYKNILQKERQALQKNIFNAIKKQKAATDTALVKARRNVARYYASEARQLLGEDNSRLAYLLAKEALKNDPKNAEAQQLQDTLLAYLSDTLFTDAEFSFSPDSTYLSLVVVINENLSTLYIWKLPTFQLIGTFPNSYSYDYSWDSKYLAFFTHVKDKEGTLQVLALDKNEPPRSFPNSYSDNYSWDSKFLFFFTDVKNNQGTLNVLALDKSEAPRSFPNSAGIGIFNYSSDSKFLSFFTDMNDTVYLNVLALDKDEAPRSFPNCYIDTYRHSRDNKFLTFFSNVELAIKKWTKR